MICKLEEAAVAKNLKRAASAGQLRSRYATTDFAARLCDIGECLQWVEAGEQRLGYLRERWLTAAAHCNANSDKAEQYHGPCRRFWNGFEFRARHNGKVEP